MSDRETPTIVLLPGLHGTAGLFAPLLDAIPREYPRQVIPYPHDQALTQEELLRYADERTPREGPLVILGESFSGPVATELAAARGGQVKLLVYSASFVSTPKPGWLCHLAAIIAGRGPRPLFAIRHALGCPEASDELVRQIRVEARTATGAVLGSRLRLIARSDARDALKRCSAPVLYLHGRRDNVVPRPSLEIIRQVRPDTKIVEFDCGHMILQLHPHDAWRAIARAAKLPC